MKIEELNLTRRVYNSLRRSGIDTVEQLSKLTDRELHQLKCIGPKAIAEIRESIGVKYHVEDVEDGK